MSPVIAAEECEWRALIVPPACAHEGYRVRVRADRFHAGGKRRDTVTVYGFQSADRPTVSEAIAQARREVGEIELRADREAALKAIADLEANLG
jgi:hypothetical protein